MSLTWVEEGCWALVEHVLGRWYQVDDELWLGVDSRLIVRNIN